jgi:predicted phage baseplate assembly protein
VTTPWWRRPEGAGDPDAQPVEEFPELVAADSRSARAAVAGRIGAFTPDWSVGSAGADAGVALVKVFGEQVAAVARQAGRLPEKHAREQLRIAGVTGRGPRPGTVMVVVNLVDAAPASVLVPAGTQLLAPASAQLTAGAAAAGQVVFETTGDLYATPSRLGMLVLQAGTRSALLLSSELVPATPVLAFGDRPRPGNALWLGFSDPAPFPRLTLAFQLTPATAGQPSVAGGGFAGPPAAGEPTLSWELLTADGLVPAELRRDDTRALGQSGIVELGTAADWPSLRHPGLLDPPEESALHWLRVGLLLGRYDAPPRVEAVQPNAVLAEGAETIRDEILEPVREVGPAPARRFQLARVPVLRRTVRLAVDAPDPADLFDLAPTRPAAQQQEWVEVDTLARSRPYDQHFVVDELTGIVTFGDGVRGAAVPAGFRQVKAVSYRTGGGLATAVTAEAGFAPRQTIPFLAGIANPTPAAGAADPEPVDDLVGRGPALVRARNRAVVAGDLEALVLQESAELGRVVTLAGADVDGTPRPGQLTVVAIGIERGDGRPPVPAEATLASVVRLLVEGRDPLAPLGARVVVRAARFVPVELEITFRPEQDADRPALVLAVARAVDRYLDPLRGAADRRGWPIGQPVRYHRLVAVVAAVPGVASVGRIAVSVGGRRSGPCRDAPLPPGTFPWPGHHLIVPDSELGGERP